MSAKWLIVAAISIVTLLSSGATLEAQAHGAGMGVSDCPTSSASAPQPSTSATSSYALANTVINQLSNPALTDTPTETITPSLPNTPTDTPTSEAPPPNLTGSISWTAPAGCFGPGVQISTNFSPNY